MTILTDFQVFFEFLNFQFPSKIMVFEVKNRVGLFFSCLNIDSKRIFVTFLFFVWNHFLASHYLATREQLQIDAKHLNENKLHTTQNEKKMQKRCETMRTNVKHVNILLKLNENMEHSQATCPNMQSNIKNEQR